MTQHRRKPNKPVFITHEKRRVPRREARGDPANIQAIQRHVERHVGPVEAVLHESTSDLVHLDIFVVAPDGRRNWYTLVTSGMSEAPMRIPHDGGYQLAHAELTICLPPDWPLLKSAFHEPRFWWPVERLLTLARLPHEDDSWLGCSHIVPDEVRPSIHAKEAGFFGVLFLPSTVLPDSFHVLLRGGSKKIEFLALYPLYPDEVTLVLHEGEAPLVGGFRRWGITDVFQVDRRNICEP